MSGCGCWLRPTLASLSAQEISTWERQIITSGYAASTARDARSKLATVLGDAIPQHLQVNPALHRKGRGRAGRRRIELHEKAEKAWPSPLQALLVAERCAALSGCDTDFVMILTIAYTGMRWSEALGLRPKCVRGDQVSIEWKLYELAGRFYGGRPKDGSIRLADLPPFLAQLLAAHLKTAGSRTCTCNAAESPWCRGERYVFLGPEGGHFRRSSYGGRFFRPAADGRYPARAKKPAARVLADAAAPFPGRPVPPWPPAVPGEPFRPPAGRGIARLISDTRAGCCPHCGRSCPRRLDGRLISHNASGSQCRGSGELPAEDATVASWLPVLPGLTPHGLRHGHQTWMEEAGISDLLRAERMGHAVPGMRGVYGHVSPAMRATLKADLQQRWEMSLVERARISERSIVPVLDALLAARQEPATKIRSHLAPKIGHRRKGRDE
jgi:integrase